LNSFILVVVAILSFFFVVHFRVEFCLLYRKSEEAFWSKQISSIGMGITILDKHISSVGKSATVPSRHIHSAETGCP